MLIKFNKVIQATDPTTKKEVVVFRPGDIAEVDEIRGLFYQVRGFFIPKTDADPYEPNAEDVLTIEENPDGAPEELISRLESELNVNPNTNDLLERPIYGHDTPIGESDHPDAKRSNPMNPKDRAASTRLDLSLVPAASIIYEALAMTEGDLKYGAYNFRAAGVNASVYMAACMRHILDWFNGDWADGKTKVPHLGSAKACLGVVIDAHEKGVLNDDRPPVADVRKLLNECEEIVRHLHTVFPPEKSPGRYTELEHGESVETK